MGIGVISSYVLATLNCVNVNYIYLYLCLLVIRIEVTFYFDIFTNFIYLQLKPIQLKYLLMQSNIIECFF